MLDQIVIAALRPFILKMLPDMFNDFDQMDCNFAVVNLRTGKMDLGKMEPFSIRHTKKYDIFEGIENEKVMGMSLNKDMVLEMVKGLKFERHPTETFVICQTKLEEFGDVKVTYKNVEVWSLMKIK